MLEEILERASDNGEDYPFEEEKRDNERNLQVEKKLSGTKTTLGNILFKLLGGLRHAQVSRLINQKHFEQTSLKTKTSQSEVGEIGKQPSIFPQQKLKSMLQEVLERTMKKSEEEKIEEREKNLELETTVCIKKSTLEKILFKFLGKYRIAQESRITNQKIVEELKLPNIIATSKVDEIVKRSVFDIFPRRQTTKMSNSKAATIIESFRKTNNPMTKSIIKRLVKKLLSTKNKTHNIGKERNATMDIICTNKNGKKSEIARCKKTF